MEKKMQTSMVLNHTLHYVVNLLSEHHITKWFIGYGTLLGIVRNNSCIDGDDDVDIICDNNDSEKLKQIFTKNGFTIVINKNNFFQITKNNSIVDFYCADVNGDHYYDKWEHVIWKNASMNGKFIKKKWNGIYLQLPYQYITKLKKRYGTNWKTPIKKYKGTQRNKSLLHYKKTNKFKIDTL